MRNVLKGIGQRLTFLRTGATILAPSPSIDRERMRRTAESNLRKKTLIGLVAGFAILGLGWYLSVIGVIKVACEVLNAVTLLAGLGAAYFWPPTPADAV